MGASPVADPVRRVASIPMIRLSVHATAVDIEPAEGVFTPTPHGLFYAESIRVHPGERVIDIGTGSGFLAILAAKRGAYVYATDVDDRAVEAAMRNAELNGVDIECRLAPMFGDDDEGAPRQFDVILANLPNEIVAPGALEKLDSAEAVAVAGGERGNELLLELLREAPRHMGFSSRLYLAVHSLTDWHGTLKAALDGFCARLLTVRELPVKSFVMDQLDFYRRLSERGIITIFERDGNWYSRGYVLELTIGG